MNNGRWFFQFDWFRSLKDSTVLVQVLDISKRYPAFQACESKQDIDRWNYDEFDANKHTPREILVAEWKETFSGSNKFVFQTTKCSMFPKKKLGCVMLFFQRNGFSEHNNR